MSAEVNNRSTNLNTVNIGLAKRMLAYHGCSLPNLTTIFEGGKYGDFDSNVAENISPHIYRNVGDSKFCDELRNFTNSKAEILLRKNFSNTAMDDSWLAVNVPPKDVSSVECCQNSFAIMPPLEMFMDVPDDLVRESFFKTVSVGDEVVACVTSVAERGLVCRLLCFAKKTSRDIEYLEIRGYIPRKFLPRINREVSLDYFQPKDKLLALVVALDLSREQVLLSCQSSENTQLGHIDDTKLPLQYVYGKRIKSRTYLEMLRDMPEFGNAALLDTLKENLQLEASSPSNYSLMSGLNRLCLDASEKAEALRKVQAASWALDSVREGIRHLKEGRQVEAMQTLNQALQIHSESVDALVARGVLWANSENYVKALEDFEAALKLNPHHKNGRRYIAQTLLRQAQDVEDAGNLLRAIGLCKRSLRFDDDEECRERLESLLSKVGNADSPGARPPPRRDSTALSPQILDAVEETSCSEVEDVSRCKRKMYRNASPLHSNSESRVGVDDPKDITCVQMTEVALDNRVEEVATDAESVVHVTLVAEDANVSETQDIPNATTNETAPRRVSQDDDEEGTMDVKKKKKHKKRKNKMKMEDVSDVGRATVNDGVYRWKTEKNFDDSSHKEQAFVPDCNSETTADGILRECHTSVRSSTGTHGNWGDSDELPKNGASFVGNHSALEISSETEDGELNEDEEVDNQQSSAKRVYRNSRVDSDDDHSHRIPRRRTPSDRSFRRSSPGDYNRLQKRSRALYGEADHADDRYYSRATPRSRSHSRRRTRSRSYDSRYSDVRRSRSSKSGSSYTSSRSRSYESKSSRSSHDKSSHYKRGHARTSTRGSFSSSRRLSSHRSYRRPQFLR